jgi:hypothetical protein
MIHTVLSCDVCGKAFWKSGSSHVEAMSDMAARESGWYICENGLHYCSYSCLSQWIERQKSKEEEDDNV